MRRRQKGIDAAMLMERRVEAIRLSTGRHDRRLGVRALPLAHPSVQTIRRGVAGVFAFTKPRRRHPHTDPASSVLREGFALLDSLDGLLRVCAVYRRNRNRIVVVIRAGSGLRDAHVTMIAGELAWLGHHQVGLRASDKLGVPADPRPAVSPDVGGRLRAQRIVEHNAFRADSDGWQAVEVGQVAIERRRTPRVECELDTTAPWLSALVAGAHQDVDLSPFKLRERRWSGPSVDPNVSQYPGDCPGRRPSGAEHMPRLSKTAVQVLDDLSVRRKRAWHRAQHEPRAGNLLGDAIAQPLQLGPPDPGGCVTSWVGHAVTAEQIVIAGILTQEAAIATTQLRRDTAEVAINGRGLDVQASSDLANPGSGGAQDEHFGLARRKVVLAQTVLHRRIKPKQVRPRAMRQQSTRVPSLCNNEE